MQYQLFNLKQDKRKKGQKQTSKQISKQISGKQKKERL